MCGIVGYIGEREAVPVLLDGLKRLEYRGYDSAGIATITSSGKICLEKQPGKLKVLEDHLKNSGISGSIGIGHTRWATHGVPSFENAHPHTDCKEQLVVVHNGIIENYQELKENLISKGHLFASQTDTEVLAHLLEEYLDNAQLTLKDAVQKMLTVIEGAYALCIMSLKFPDELFVTRHGSPLVIGIGDGEQFVASDVPALLKHTKRVIYLDDGEMAKLTKEKVEIFTLNGKEKQKETHTITWSAEAAEKAGYPHFMLKEIFEQPRVILDTLRGRIARDGHIFFEEMNISEDWFKNKMQRLYIVACGTAYYAGFTGKYLLEEKTNVPVEIDIASEFRYRRMKFNENDIVLAITQSGETADTLASIREAKRQGAKVLSICNVVGSTIARESDAVIYTFAGPEICVASTKAYTSQLTAMYLLTFYLGYLRGTLTKDDVKQYLAKLKDMAGKVERTLMLSEKIEKGIIKYADRIHFLYLGRSFNFPNALEGALKLKEISYIHAEGYAAGELKHGPIALIDKDMPVVCLAINSATYDKMFSNIQEVKARGGIIISIATKGNAKIAEFSDEIFYVPECEEFFSPLVTVIPLQMIAYELARARGCDIDQPRNLAKSVTVE